jgi:hypothetical protein
MQISKFEMRINILSFSRRFSLHSRRILYENTVFQGMCAIQIRRKAAVKNENKEEKGKEYCGKMLVQHRSKDFAEQKITFE